MRRACGLALTLLAVGWAPASVASESNGFDVGYIYEVLLDTDNNAATGGAVGVVQGTEDPHDEVGIDYIVRVGAGVPVFPVFGGAVSTGPAVVYRDVLAWDANTTSFDPVDHDSSMYPLGTNAQGNGLVEFGAPLSLIGNPQGAVRGVFHAFAREVQDNDYTASFVIGAARAPSSSRASLLLLVALLLTAGIILVRRQRLGLRATMVAVAVLLAGSIAWAQGIVLDGDFADWSGIGPVVRDVAGDSSISDPAEDIVAGYVLPQGPSIFFRMDLASLFVVG